MSFLLPMCVAKPTLISQLCCSFTFCGHIVQFQTWWCQYMWRTCAQTFVGDMYHAPGCTKTDTCTMLYQKQTQTCSGAQSSNGGLVPWVIVGAQDNRPKLYQTLLNTFQCSQDFFSVLNTVFCWNHVHWKCWASATQQSKTEEAGKSLETIQFSWIHWTAWTAQQSGDRWGWKKILTVLMMSLLATLDQAICKEIICNWCWTRLDCTPWFYGAPKQWWWENHYWGLPAFHKWDVATFSCKWLKQVPSTWKEKLFCEEIDFFCNTTRQWRS